MESQRNVILKALQLGRRLTPLDALRDFSCFRLGARIYELRQAGHPIQSKMIEVEGRLHGKARVKQYWLED